MSRALRVPTDSALEVILDASESTVTAVAGMLHSIAEPTRPWSLSSGIAAKAAELRSAWSASKCSATFATSLRWYAQQILDEHAKRTATETRTVA